MYGQTTNRAAGPRRQPFPYGSVSIFKEQTLGAYPRREARGPCPSRTGRVKVVRPAERHRCLFVAFRSAKVAWISRYFRGAKGDNSSPAYRRPSWDCANRASVDRCQRGFGRSEAPEGMPKALRDNKLPISNVSGTLRVPLFPGGTRPRCTWCPVPDTIAATYCRTAPTGTVPALRPQSHFGRCGLPARGCTSGPATEPARQRVCESTGLSP